MRCVWLILLVPLMAQAHGGLPISETIVPRQGMLVVPTKYWGVFLGNESTPFTWICEEAINKDQGRAWALTLDGTYHVTDYAGVTTSTDGGCTWRSAGGEIAARTTSAVVADPVDGKRAWATTAEGSDAPWNGLFVTADDGATWTAALQADEYLRGVALSSDGQVVYATGASRAQGVPTLTLHLSKDGGKTFASSPLAWQFAVPDGGAFTPSQIAPIAVDPQTPSTVYFRVSTDPTDVLLRSDDSGQTLTELLRVDRNPASTWPAIGGLAFDEGRKTLLVATQRGIYRGPLGGALAPVGNLTQAQCVIVSGATVYACGWNYAPDNAALARSDDGGDTFKSIFQYSDTVGPVTTCPPSTPVAQICPGIWQNYASQLGIPVPDMGVAPPPSMHCSCALGSPVHVNVNVIVIVNVIAFVIAYRRRKASRPA